MNVSLDIGDDVTVTPAVQRLVALGIEHEVLEYVHDPANRHFGEEAAQQLRLNEDQVMKTLIVLADDAEVCAVVPVSAQLSLKQCAAAIGAKRAVMCPPERAERVTGYLVGGISPVGQKRQLHTIVDETAQLFDKVYVSGGRRGLDISLRPDDLLRATNAMYADIAAFS